MWSERPFTITVDRRCCFIVAKLKKFMKDDFPTKLGKLIEAANSEGAAVMFSDTEDKILYTNSVFSNIYAHCGDPTNHTYDEFAWRCIDKSLLDDPFAYHDPHGWIVRATNYRKGTRFGQYFIRHHTKRVYLVRHQIVDEYGILSIRLDVTNEFHEGLRTFFSRKFWIDNSPSAGQENASPFELDVAAGIFSPSATLIDADQQLLDILGQANGLHLRGRRLCAASTVETEILHKLVHKYCDVRSPIPSKILRISKKDGGGYFFIKIGLVRSGLFASDAEVYGACAVGVIDPMREVSLPCSVLQQVFDFTAAEARVALQLASGNSPEEIACKGNVSVGTVRNQIKSIFKKASVNKRSDLVRVIANLSRLVVCS